MHAHKPRLVKYEELLAEQEDLLSSEVESSDLIHRHQAEDVWGLLQANPDHQCPPL